MLYYSTKCFLLASLKTRDIYCGKVVRWRRLLVLFFTYFSFFHINSAHHRNTLASVLIFWGKHVFSAVWPSFGLVSLLLRWRGRLSEVQIGATAILQSFQIKLDHFNSFEFFVPLFKIWTFQAARKTSVNHFNYNDSDLHLVYVLFFYSKGTLEIRHYEHVSLCIVQYARFSCTYKY